MLKGEFLANVNIPNELYTENILQLLFAGVTTSIKSSRCNGKDCYYIVNLMSPDILTGENGGLYIDKETGLTIRSNNGTSKHDDGTITDCVCDTQYKFNVVTDDIFIEPDLSEYKIQENN